MKPGEVWLADMWKGILSCLKYCYFGMDRVGNEALLMRPPGQDLDDLGRSGPGPESIDSY